jgi:putative transposase
MARLSRLVVAGHPHHLIQRGNNGEPIFIDASDRQLFLQLLGEAAAAHGVAVHAYALLDAEVQWLATPRAPQGLSRTVQTLGRRYVSAFNRRHHRSGTLWEGRFRAGVIESERYFLASMRYVELAPVAAGLAAQAADWPWSSAAHHLGLRHDPLIADHPLYWALGNTPFERELAYRGLMEQGVGQAEMQALAHAAAQGWAFGSPAFLERLAETTPRPLRPRPRGRPRKVPAPE